MIHPPPNRGINVFVLHSVTKNIPLGTHLSRHYTVS